MKVDGRRKKKIEILEELNKATPISCGRKV
jgi:hypothetical protein